MGTTLFYNGIFHSNTAKDDTFSAMAVKNGRILKTYKTKPDLTFRKQVNLNGQHVYPCLIDGHAHVMLSIAVMAMGFNICQINSAGVSPNTLEGVEQKIRAYCQGLRKNAVVVMNNFVVSAMAEKRLPNARELDTWSGNRACVIYNIDGHSMALSTKMMKLCKIESPTGVLTGVENEQAQGRLINTISSKMNIKSIAKGVSEFQNKCAEYGISTVAALEGNGDTEKDTVTDLLVALARRFKINIRLFAQYTDTRRADKYRKFMTTPRIGGCGQWEMDGSVGSHSAAFDEPFIDTNAKHECYYSQSEANDIVANAIKMGYQVGSHAIGSAAIERLVTALDNAYDPQSKVMHIVEHCEFPSDSIFEKLKSARYAVMMQPGYAWIDKRYLHSYEQTLSQNIIDSMKLRSFYDAGIVLCGSSDSPVQDLDPYLQMQGMTEFYKQEESLNPYEAFCCYTKNAAKALMEEDSRGTLEEGKVADFFTAKQDLFEVKSSEISTFRPNQTYINGQRWKKMKGTLGNLIKLILQRPHKI